MDSWMLLKKHFKDMELLDLIKVWLPLFSEIFLQTFVILVVMVKFHLLMCEGLTKDLLTKKGEKPTISTLLVAGGMGGVGYWSLCYPLDIIKSTIQTDSPSERKYKTISQTAKMIYKEFGMKGFYRGFTPCLVRSFPANAVCFTAYEMTKKKLENF
jgi:hypothetical protein